MGCFHVAKSRRHMEQDKLRSTKSYNSWYDNQPALLPDPHTIETRSHSQLLSMPSQSSSEFDLQPLSQGPSDQFPPCMMVNLSGASGGLRSNSNKRSPETAASICRAVPLPAPHEAGHPLPLPLRRSSYSSNPRCENQLKFSKTSQSLSFGSEPQPLPLPSQVMSFQFFRHEEIVAGCEGFSQLHWLRNTRFGSIYRCFLRNPGSNNMEVDVTRMSRSNTKAEDECFSYFESLAQVRSPFVSKFLGLCMPKAVGESTKHSEWLIVFEHCKSETLETLLRKHDQFELDWSARIKIALGIARGLEYLLEKLQLQGSFDGELDLCDILVDKNQNPKLSNYGLTYFIKDSVPETNQGRSVSGKVVKNFGLLLLALLVARQYVDGVILKDDEILQNIRPLLGDAAKLRTILDPALKGQQIVGSVEKVANLAFQCLQDVSETRPQLQEILEVLYSNQIAKNMKPLKSFRSPMCPTAAPRHNLPLSRSSSINPTTRKMFELPQLVADSLEEHQKTQKNSAGLTTQAPLRPLSTNAAASANKTPRSMFGKLDNQPPQKLTKTPNLRCSYTFGRHELGRSDFYAKLYQTS